MLLHGWPYDIHTYVDVAPLLAAKGYRVIVPYLRGYGSTRFLSADAARNGQQAVIAVDVIALMDALRIDKAIVAGCDWGARTANIVAALWPERCKALVSVSGYLIGSREANKKPLPPEAELAVVVSVLLRDRTRPRRLRDVSARVCEADLAARVAEMELRRCDVRAKRRVVRQSRSRRASSSTTIAGAWVWPKASRRMTRSRRGSRPVRSITVPTITLEGDANGAPHPPPAAYAKKFSGKYAHRNLTGGIGHNLPQEAPQAFAAAVIDVDAL